MHRWHSFVILSRRGKEIERMKKKLSRLKIASSFVIATFLFSFLFFKFSICSSIEHFAGQFFWFCFLTASHYREKLFVIFAMHNTFLLLGLFSLLQQTNICLWTTNAIDVPFSLSSPFRCDSNLLLSIKQIWLHAFLFIVRTIVSLAHNSIIDFFHCHCDPARQHTRASVRKPRT